MVVGYMTAYSISAYHQSPCEFEFHSGDVCSIQQYVINFASDLHLVGAFLIKIASDLRQVGGFLIKIASDLCQVGAFLIKIASDLCQVGGFLRVLWYSPPIKLTDII